MDDDSRVAANTTHREALYAAFDADAPLDERIDRALEISCDRLDVPNGYVSELADGIQRITHSVGPHPGIEPGASCPLDLTYCKRTLEYEAPVAINHAAESEDTNPAAYEQFGLETYLGCPIFVEGEIYGTICFVEEEPRAEPFVESDLMFIELLCRLVGTALERRNHERVVAERNRELARERDRLRTIADNSFDVLFRIDPDGTLTYLSSAVERVLGYSPAELEGEHIETILSTDAANQLDAVLEEISAGRGVEGEWFELRDVHGEVVTVETNAMPVVEDDELVAIQGIARDVTERAARQAELHVKNRVMDGTDAGITISKMTDAGPVIEYVNEGFERLTGYALSAISEGGWSMLTGDGSNRADGERVLAAISAGEAIAEDLVSYRRDGSPFWHRLQITPITDDTGRVTHIAGFHEDVTENKREAVLFSVLNRVLRHNLRNQMTVLQGHAGRMETARQGEREAISADVRSMVGRLTEVSDRARELESYARSERVPERLDVRTIVDAAVAEAATDSAVVRTDIPADCSVCAGPAVERALSELVENACVHDDRPPTMLKVAAHVDGDDVVITVTDDGPGIPDTESAVFETGRETPLAHSGGLGLWLVNWLVTRYGGSFQITAITESGRRWRPSATEEDDQRAEGTVATIRLPRITDAERVTDVARPPTPLFQ